MPKAKRPVPAAAALELLEQFALAHGLTAADLLAAAAAQGPSIPATAFATDRTPLETVVSFLSERSLTTKAIGAAIARPNSTVLNALKSARKKPAAPVTDSAYTIPVSVLRDTRISPAEAVIAHLRDYYKLTNKSVAAVLGRDQRNTWQLYKSACKKREVRT